MAEVKENNFKQTEIGLILDDREVAEVKQGKTPQSGMNMMISKALEL